MDLSNHKSLENSAQAPVARIFGHVVQGGKQGNINGSNALC
jgi:hypothetical protein